MSTQKDRENVKEVCDRLAKLKEKKGNRDKKKEKKWRMPVASKVKMSEVKKMRTGTQATNFF